MFSKVDGALARIASEKESQSQSKADCLEAMAQEQEHAAKRLRLEAKDFRAQASSSGNFVGLELEGTATICDSRAALLRESAALWRERHPDDALWELEYQRRYKRFDLAVFENFIGNWHWSATYGGLQDQSGTAPSLDAAKSAAIQWVDQREGE